MIEMKKVFIASPYSHGDINENLKKQRDAANILIDLGLIPLPISFCYHFLEKPRDYQLWINITLEWVEDCDILLRLPGDSIGADGEVERAKELGIPVFYSIDDLTDFLKLGNLTIKC